MATIYVGLVDEAIDVWRPVHAEREGDFYRIVDSMPDDERWVFRPGSLVRSERRALDGGAVLVAVEAV